MYLLLLRLSCLFGGYKGSRSKNKRMRDRMEMTQALKIIFKNN